MQGIDQWLKPKTGAFSQMLEGLVVTVLLDLSLVASVLANKQNKESE